MSLGGKALHPPRGHSLLVGSLRPLLLAGSVRRNLDPEVPETSDWSKVTLLWDERDNERRWYWWLKYVSDVAT